MRILFYAIILAALAVAGWSVAHVVPLSGAVQPLEPRLVSECRRVDIAPGTEDITVDPDLNVAFVSAADRRAWFNDGGAQHNPRNGIYTLALDGTDAVTRVSPEMGDFHPHGISLWRGPDGGKRLFVVNHGISGSETVEIFDVGDNAALTHLESVSFDAMHSPNDVVAVGPKQFYATNDRGFKTGLMSTLEAYLVLPFSSAVYFDGEDGGLIQTGLTYANGINRSADGETIYIAEFLRRRVSVFDRDAQSGALTRNKTIKVNTGPDNIEVAQDGALWIGGHSKVFDFLAHAEDETKIAPSHVIRVNPRNEVASDVFISTEGEINGSSVGAVWDDTLIVGAVFDGHVMVCPMVEILLTGPSQS